MLVTGRCKYGTRTRTYETAVAALNTLQSNFSIVQMIRDNRREMNLRAIPEMIEWCNKAGYQPTDFDKLNLIHLAGTKGKGSTGAFISSILSQYLPNKLSIDAERVPSNVGLYTSPHLRFVRERIQINGEFIHEEKFARYFYDIWDRLESFAIKEGNTDPTSPDTKPVYFRYLTLMALHCYLQESIGTAVIECGIGGEYDSTNILVKPSVTAITSLGIDHTPILGDTLEMIAWHKAGIFKSGVPAFTAPQPPAALAVLKARAQERQTSLQMTPDYAAIGNVKLGLRGEFQKTNAALAVAVAATHLQRMGYSNLPDPLDPLASLPPEFVTGLRSARLGGRCEVRVDRVAEALTWYIDGAHTVESLQSAARWYVSELRRSSSDNRRILVFNQQSRDRAGLARTLHETLAHTLQSKHTFSDVIFCTNTTYRQRGYQADLVSINTDHTDVESLTVQRDLAETWKALDDTAAVHVVSTVEEAIELARELGDGLETSVMIAGSLHLVGGAIEVLESEAEVAARQVAS